MLWREVWILVVINSDGCFSSLELLPLAAIYNGYSRQSLLLQPGKVKQHHCNFKHSKLVLIYMSLLYIYIFSYVGVKVKPIFLV